MTTLAAANDLFIVFGRNLDLSKARA